MSRKILSLANLTSWLAKQSPKKTYNYLDNCGCAIAQYLKAQGFENPNVGSFSFTYGPYTRRRSEALPKNFDLVSGGRGGSYGAVTFGTALKRARRLLTSTDGTKS